MQFPPRALFFLTYGASPAEGAVPADHPSLRLILRSGASNSEGALPAEVQPNRETTVAATLRSIWPRASRES